MKASYPATVRFSIFLILGTISAYYFDIPFLLLEVLLCCYFLLLVFWLWQRKKLIPTVYFGFLTFLCFFTIGAFNYQIRLPQHQAKHYSHFISEENPELLQIKIVQNLKPDKFNNKYVGMVQAINSTSTKGKVLLQITKQDFQKHYLSDEQILVLGKISTLPQPKNPHQFDYSSYLNSLGIHGQTQIKEQDILSRQYGKPTLVGRSQNFRAKLIDKLKQTNLKTAELSITQALILGEKKDIEKELYAEYAAAGAAHILAVSGLHVGILYLILGYLLNPLKRIKRGVLIRSILIVLLLWAFALLSGLSPSVTRAVSMFSFFALAELLNRQRMPINILFLSLLSLLLINPRWLFQVGFQLSYLAVFFILWLFPLLKNKFKPRNYFLKKSWDISCVTISAQLGVLPLAIYYFNQFPGLFLLTNIVVLPFISVLMFAGILIVALASFEILPEWLGDIYNFTLESLNGFIHWIAVQDQFLFTGLYLSKSQVLGLYMLIISLVLFLKKPSHKKLSVSLLAIIILLSFEMNNKLKTNSSELVIFHKSKQSLLSHKSAQKMTIYTSDSTQYVVDQYPLKNYIPRMRIKEFKEEKLQHIFRYQNKNILVLDSLGVYPNTKSIAVVVLTQSPKVNLERLIDSLNPKIIIADGSNYTSYVSRWEKTCATKKLPFKHTAKTGAVILD